MGRSALTGWTRIALPLRVSHFVQKHAKRPEQDDHPHSLRTQTQGSVSSVPGMHLARCRPVGGLRNAVHPPTARRDPTMTTLDALVLSTRSTWLDRVSIGRPALAERTVRALRRVGIVRFVVSTERTADVVFDGPAIHAPFLPAFGPTAASASSWNSGEPGSCDREVPS
jgi:hypothetical protein